MAVKIRLARRGGKKRPFYHIVAADERSPRDGKFIEKIGTFDPLITKGDSQRIIVKKDRLEYWLGVGAQKTDKVSRILAEVSLSEKPMVFVQTKKDKPKAKALERMKEKEAKAQEKEEAKNPPESEEKSGAEEANPEENSSVETEKPEETQAEASSSSVETEKPEETVKEEEQKA